MSDFATLTRVAQAGEPGETSHRIAFDEQTMIFGVNGGYIAAALLRAAAASSRFPRPSNMTVHFLRPVLAGESEIETAVIRQTRSADLVEVRLLQNGRVCALSHIWTGATGGLGAKGRSRMPNAPHPDELRSRPLGQHPFWDVFDERPINSVDPLSRRSLQPEFLRWVRYRDLSEPGDLFMSAAVTLPVADIAGFPSASRGHSDLLGGAVPVTLQLAVQFYELEELGEWMLADALTESICDGVISTSVRIWSLAGAPVAQGHTQMLVRGALAL